MASISTVVVVTVTLLTRPTEDSVLVRFFDRVRPPGFWRKTSQKLRIDSAEPVKEFRQGAYLTITVSISVYLLLIGFGKVLFPISTGSTITAVVYIGLGLASIPLWYRRVLKKDDLD
jgi:hypothetical protein